MFEIEDYSYELPQASIAQVPAPRRDSSRLLVVDRLRRSFSDKMFFDLPKLLRLGDLLVVNDTRVVPARLLGRKESGGKVEILVLEHPDSTGEESQTRWCLLRSAKRPKKGAILLFGAGFSGRVSEIGHDGLVRIGFKGDRSIDSLIEEEGQIPLPPYIRRGKDSPFSRLDKERYQTIFSRRKGAVAAPTAGLHFTEALLKKLKAAGISLVSLTLHVGYGTFQPVRARDIRRHRLGKEFYSIEQNTAETIKGAKERGGRVIAVGTTVVRALETAAGPEGYIREGEGETDLLVTPGFSFKVVDALITNFHLPKSSLLFLVSALAGLELIKEAYGAAIEKGYRFYSYGDAMLIL
jgi:S-adenosylmethionine:tRNA ribosyltransferase-isomerase